MDTAVLSIPGYKYKVLLPSNFKPPFRPIDPQYFYARQKFLDENNGFKKYIQNVSSTYRKIGNVYPNLTIYELHKGGIYTCNLHISCSIPKLLWGHSYKETTDADKEKVIELLVIRLKFMGVIVDKETLINATLQTLHYSSNIMFPSLEEAKIFLDRLNKTSLGKRFENNVKTYSFDGKSVRFHTDIFEINFYLKYADVLQPGNRSVDRLKTFQEIQIASQYKKSGNYPPVVRMEVRFIGTRSISTHLKAALSKDRQYWSFNDAFNVQISNKVLLHFWNKLIEDRLNYFILSKTSDQDVCLRVQAELKGEKSKTIDEAMGLYFRLKTLGVKGLKEDMLFRHTRQTYKKKMDNLLKFIDRFVGQDDYLIKVVTSTLEGNIDRRTYGANEQTGFDFK